MASLGNRLRQHRLSQGVELSQIAEETKICVRYLEALENEDWETLPGSLFARSFARQYAKLIGLDEKSIEKELQELFSVEPEQVLEPPVSRHSIVVEPLPEIAGKGPGVWERLPKPMVGLAAALVLCSAVFLGWQRIQDVMITGAAQQQAQIRQEPAPSQTATAPSASAEPQPDVEAPVLDTAETGREILPVPAPQTQGAGMAVEIVASDRTWVSIQANGKKVFSGILQANDVRAMKGVETARMIVGNAGGLDVLADGKSIGPIGPVGQVRIVLLTPSGPQILRRSQNGDGVLSESGAD